MGAFYDQTAGSDLDIIQQKGSLKNNGAARGTCPASGQMFEWV